MDGSFSTRLAGNELRPAGILRIVIIEDSAVIRTRLVEALAELPGVEVVGAADSEREAIALIERLTPDAVVLDLGLREGNGFNVMVEIRKRHPPSQLRIIVLTNLAHAAVRERSAAFGADHFLDKAHEFERVGQLIGEMSDAARARGQAMGAWSDPDRAGLAGSAG